MIETATRIAAANYSKLPERAGYALTIEGENIALFKLTNGDVRAIENCSPNPRGGVPADGLVSGEFIFDAVYDWKISLIDGKVQAPDDGQVKTYPVEIEDDIVYILI